MSETPDDRAARQAKELEDELRRLMERRDRGIPADEPPKRPEPPENLESLTFEDIPLELKPTEEHVKDELQLLEDDLKAHAEKIGRATGRMPDVPDWNPPPRPLVIEPPKGDDSMRGLAVGLQIAYLIVGTPLFGFFIGWVIDLQIPPSTAGRAFGTLLGAIFGLVFGLWTLVKLSDRR